MAGACPRCTFPLTVIEHEKVELDHCRRCGGTFLDAGEEKEVIGAMVDPSYWSSGGFVHKSDSPGLVCPKDQKSLDGYIVKVDEDQSVEVDLCPKCGGMWFDAGEGVKLREIMMKLGQSNVELAEEPGWASYFFQLFSGFPIERWNPTHGRRRAVAANAAQPMLP